MTDPRRRLLRPLVLVGLLALCTSAGAAIRVTPEGEAPFTLVEVASADGTRWYDAEAWLHRFPGTTEADGASVRVTYREGRRTVALQASPPQTSVGGRSFGDDAATRVFDGRLTVSERFLVERSSDFLGRRVATEPVHGTGVLRVVLDPGHGGPDKGNTAPGAPAERDAVLQLASETASRLKKKGFEVVLTREGNRALSLAERAGVANRVQADLFLSLHASGSARPQARGYEVFLAEGAQNAGDEALWTAGQAPWRAQSRRWAEVVHDEAGSVLGSFDRGVREFPSPLLEAVAAPACLLEAGNLSWPEDAEVFTSSTQRAALASALADAVEKYFRTPP